MTVKEIIEKYLLDNNYDGLFNDDAECACEIENLFPCDCIGKDCQSGYRVPCNCGDHDWHMVAKKPIEKI